MADDRVKTPLRKEDRKACTMGAVTADFTPRRVVCLQPSATVILAALGRLDRVVACTRYCADVCPEVNDGGRSIVADSWTAQSQQIMAARPDLVIAAVPYQEKAVVEILKAGVRFLGLAPKTLADIYTDIATIAGVVGAGERGQSVIADMQREIGALRASGCTSDATAPRLLRRVGQTADCVADHGWRNWSKLQAASSWATREHGRQRSRFWPMHPEVVVAAWCGAGDRVPLQKIVRERGWQEMPAVRAGRVYCIRDELLNTPAPTLVHGLRALAAAIHPGAFPHPEGLRCISRNASLTARVSA